MKHRAKLRQHERIQPELFLKSVERLAESFGNNGGTKRKRPDDHPASHAEQLTKWLTQHDDARSLDEEILADNEFCNLETWKTYEWLKGDDFQSRYWKLQAEETWEKLGEEVDDGSRPELAKYILADLMREKLIPEFIPGCNFIQVLFRSAYDEVDWLELASLFLEELDDENE